MRELADGRGLAKVNPTARAIVNGDITDLSDWDDAELLRGQRKNKNGKFVGARPKLVPYQCLTELNRRRFARAADVLADSLVDGAEALAAMIVDPETDEGIRLKAIELLFDRVLGKPKESIALDISSMGEVAPWKTMVEDSIVSSVEQARSILKAEREVVDVEAAPDRPARKKVRRRPQK